MRNFCIIVLSLISTCSWSQSFEYPKVAQTGNGINYFIPSGWIMLDSASGQLNKDNKTDYALVLQWKDSVQIAHTSIEITDTVITQPRMLLILLGNEEGTGYNLFIQSNTFILNHNNPSMEDPFKGMSIHEGRITFNFKLFYTIGSWYVTETSYTFGFKKQELELFSANYTSLHRATGEMDHYKFNFLNRKREKITEKEAGKPQKPQTLKLPKQELKTLKTFPRPFSWEVEPDILL